MNALGRGEYPSLMPIPPYVEDFVKAFDTYILVNAVPQLALFDARSAVLVQTYAQDFAKVWNNLAPSNPLGALALRKDRDVLALPPRRRMFVGIGPFEITFEKSHFGLYSHRPRVSCERYVGLCAGPVVEFARKWPFYAWAEGQTTVTLSVKDQRTYLLRETVVDVYVLRNVPRTAME